MKYSFPIVCLILCLIGTSFTGCRKYPDGPTFSLASRENRVSNVWTAESIFRNDIDELERYGEFSMNFNKSGRLTWRIGIDGADSQEILADWELASVDEQIKLTFDEKDPVSGETRLLYIDILRLEQDAMWIRYLVEGDYYDVRLK